VQKRQNVKGKRKTKQEIYEIAEELEERKFEVVIYKSVKSCFDILAKKN